MTPEHNREERDNRESVRLQTKRMKKSILLILGAVACLIVILALVVFLIETIVSKRSPDTPDDQYSFYPIYDGDIMQNAEYLGLDRQVNYCNDPSGYGLTQSITEENFSDFDAGVLFLYDYIQIIIAGDAEAYNNCFNAVYYQNSAPLEDFSPQMLHQIEICYQETTKENDGSRTVTYRLDYMIHRNDGTFRRDVGSDAIRPQFVTLRILPNGDISIEVLKTKFNKN